MLASASPSSLEVADTFLTPYVAVTPGFGRTERLPERLKLDTQQPLANIRESPWV
jgi:hypothetical protein